MPAAGALGGALVEYFFSGPIGVAVGFDAVLYGGGITTTKTNCHGNAIFMAFVENEFIPLKETLMGQGEFSKTVFP